MPQAEEAIAAFGYRGIRARSGAVTTLPPIEGDAVAEAIRNVHPALYPIPDSDARWAGWDPRFEPDCLPRKAPVVGRLRRWRPGDTAPAPLASCSCCTREHWHQGLPTPGDFLLEI